MSNTTNLEIESSFRQVQRHAGVCRYALRTLDRIRDGLADESDMPTARRRAIRAAECLDQRLDETATRRAIAYLSNGAAPDSGFAQLALELEHAMDNARAALERVNDALTGEASVERGLRRVDAAIDSVAHELESLLEHTRRVLDSGRAVPPAPHHWPEDILWPNAATEASREWLTNDAA